MKLGLKTLTVPINNSLRLGSIAPDFEARTTNVCLLPSAEHIESGLMYNRFIG